MNRCSLFLLLSPFFFLSLALGQEKAEKSDEEKVAATPANILKYRIVAPDEFTEAELASFAYRKFNLPPAAITQDDPEAKPYLEAFKRLAADTSKERAQAVRELENLPMQPRLLMALRRASDDIEQRASGGQILKTWSQQLSNLPEIRDLGTIRKLPLTATKIQALRRLGVQHSEVEQRTIARKLQFHDLHGLPPERRARALDAWFRPLNTDQKDTQFLLNHVGRAYPLAEETQDAERVNQALDWITGKSLAFSQQRLWMTVAWGRHLPPGLDRDALLRRAVVGAEASQYGVLTLIRDGYKPAYGKIAGAVDSNSDFLYNMLPALRFIDGAPAAARTAARDAFADAWLARMKIFDDGRGKDGQPIGYTHYMNYLMQNLNSLVDHPEVVDALRGWSKGEKNLRLHAPAAQFAYLAGDPAPFRALDREAIAPHLRNSLLRHTHFSRLVGHMTFRLLTAADEAERKAARADLEALAELQLAIIDTYRDKSKREIPLPSHPKGPRRLDHHSSEIAGLLLSEIWPLGARPKVLPSLQKLADWGEGPHRGHNQRLVPALLEAARLEGEGAFDQTVKKWTDSDGSVMNALQGEVALASRGDQLGKLLQDHWAELKPVNSHIVHEALAKAGSAEQLRESGQAIPYETLYQVEGLPRATYTGRDPKWVAILDLRHGHDEQLGEVPDLSWRVIRKSVLDLLDREQIDPKMVREALANWEKKLITIRNDRGMPWDDVLHEIAHLAHASGYTFKQNAEHPRVRATSAIVTALVAERNGDWKTAASSWQKLWPLIPTIGRAAKHPGWKQEELICRWLAGENQQALIKEGKALRYPYLPHVPKTWILFLIEQNRHAAALDTYRLCEFDACAVDEVPAWITLNIAWSAAILGEFERAALLAERSIKQGGGGARLAEQAADLYRWSKNPSERFENYLDARATMDLEALAAFKNVDDSALAALVGYQLAVANPTAETLGEFSGEDTTFGRLGAAMAAATKTKARCRLTESPLHLKSAAKELSPHTPLLCFTVQPDMAAKPFTLLTWFDRRGIPIDIGTTVRPHPGHGYLWQLRMSPHFIQSGPRLLLAESSEGDELHPMVVQEISSE